MGKGRGDGGRRVLWRRDGDAAGVAMAMGASYQDRGGWPGRARWMTHDPSALVSEAGVSYIVHAP
jgi:hypothetical protein